MHKRFVASIIARIWLIVCLMMLIPLGWAVNDDFHSRETVVFAGTILAGILTAGFLLLRFPVKERDYQKVNAKDGLAIVGLSWLFLSLFGALPFYFTQAAPTFTDAFFEVVSGFTTTGATIITDIEILPRGILFWRSMTHWLGGMGIIVLYLALLPALGQNAFQLFKAEAPGISVERIQPRIKETAKILWTVYFLLSFFETVLLMAGGMPVFDALCHTFGTMATGGFSTKNASIAAYGPYVQWVITVFMLLAGANFMLHYMAMRGRLTAYIRSQEFRVYFLIILCLIPVFALFLQVLHLSESPVRDAAFQVVAIMTTTGFVTADFELWPQTLKLILLILMFIGGCGGSTGGGMKVVRVMVAIKAAFRSTLQAIFPNAVVPVKFEGQPVPSRIVQGVLAYFVIFMTLFFAGAVFLTLTDNCDLLTALSASIASLSNIGPGLGRVGAAQNYAWISIQGKWVLTFLMLAGRLELYSILILFLPSTWKK